MANELQQLREKYADLEAKYTGVMGGSYGGGSDDRKADYNYLHAEQ